MQFKFLTATAIVFSICGIVGCDDSRGIVPVKGRVTFNGRQPPNSGRINFGPQGVQDGAKQRPGYAAFDADGDFVVTSYKPGDGLLPGTYRALVVCVERDPPPTPDGLDSVTYVAPNYQGQEIIIAPGSAPQELLIDVPLKK